VQIIRNVTLAIVKPLKRGLSGNYKL